MRLLVVASDPREFTGIVSRAESLQNLPLPVDWTRHVRLNGNELLLIANGVGVARSAAAVDAAASWTPDALASTGFCGALDPRLRIGDIVAAQCVVHGGKRYVTAQAGGPVVITTERVVQTAAERRNLFATGAAAVDMEAAGVASRAMALNLPFFCVKGVSDTAGEDMANDFNRSLKADGHFDTINLLLGALGRPFTRIPELIRLGARCVRVSQSLGDFFADCRF
jgi:adenosylhomocysteine nucleosidase